jgi:hypothetical protein
VVAGKIDGVLGRIADSWLQQSRDQISAEGKSKAEASAIASGAQTTRFKPEAAAPGYQINLRGSLGG